MEKKIALVFQPSYYEALEDGEFTQEEKGDILDALCRFQFYGEIPQFTNPKYKMFWKLVQPTITTSANKYMAAVENGKKGGVPKGTEPWNKGKKLNNSEPNANQTANQITKQTAKQDIDKDIDIDNNKNINKDIDNNKNINNDIDNNISNDVVESVYDEYTSRYNERMKELSHIKQNKHKGSVFNV
jgi:hypothetical protein